MKPKGESWRPASGHSPDAGFSMVEVVIAIGIIGAAMMTVLMASSTGTIFQGMARQRQTGVAVANQVMEKLRALPLSDLKQGIDDSAFVGSGGVSLDPNIIKCKQGIYRLFSCSSTADVGSAESIVHSSCLSGCVMAAAPLGAGNVGTFVSNGVTYTWHAYLTRRSPVLPDRFVVVVDWTFRGRPGSVRLQSLSWAAVGCLGTQTHYVSAPCGGGSGGDSSNQLMTVRVTWTDVNGLPQEFAWSPGAISGSYRTEPSQGTFLNGKVAFPNGALAQIDVDTDPTTTGIADYAAWTTSQTTTASYATWPTIKTVGYPTGETVEARFSGSGTLTLPRGELVAGLKAPPLANSDCNISPFSLGTAAPCMGVWTYGGTWPSTLYFRKSATVAFPLLKVSDWQASLGVSGNPVTYVMARKFPSVDLAGYGNSPTAGIGCEDVANLCSAFMTTLTSVCDSVSFALGSTTVTSGSQCRDYSISPPPSVAHWGKSSALPATAPYAYDAITPTVDGPHQYGRMWKVSSFSFSFGTNSSPAVATFRYQVFSCDYWRDANGGNLDDCSVASSYGSTTPANAGGRHRRVVEETPIGGLSITVTFPALSAAAASYEDW